MAGTEKFRRALFPVVGATKVRALRSERHHLLVREFNYPGGLFLTGNFPAIYSVLAEDPFDGSLGRQRGDIAGFDPVGFSPSFRRQKEIEQGGRCQGGADGCPKPVDECEVKPAARWWCRRLHLFILGSTVR